MTLPDRTQTGATFFALAFALALATTPAMAAEPQPPAPNAEQLAEQAYQQHAAGNDAEAIATYLSAYELSKAAAILYNVATIYDRRLRERGLAEDYYRRYLLAIDAEPDLVRKATERLTALKKEDDDDAAAKRAAITVVPVPGPAPPAPAVQVEPPTPPSSLPAAETAPAVTSSGHAWRTVGLVGAAVGLAGIGTSIALGVVAKGKNDDANAVCNGAACSSQAGVNLANQAGTFATASTVCFAAGLGLLGGGVAAYLLAPKDSPASTVARVSLSPEVGPAQLGLGIRGSF